MHHTQKKIRIAITGPESTGKTTLAKQLAEIFDGEYIPEYAREYVEKLPHHYAFEDIEAIAGMQVEQYRQTENSSTPVFFFDTWLIITKVWFEWVYGRVPNWLEHEIQKCQMDLYLLCRPDLPWEADRVRENSGENRIKLYNEYLGNLRDYRFNFIEIEGVGEERLENAISAVHRFYTQT